MFKNKKLDKTERRILGALIKKVFRFIGSLEPEELDLLSKITSNVICKKITFEDEEND